MASKQDSGAKKDGGLTAAGAPGYVPRLKAHYQEHVVPKLMSEFDLANRMAVPTVRKVVLNMGVGEATQNIKVLDAAAEELTQIAGQRAAITRAKKSIANFKVREGMPIGCCVTLRGPRMWEFLDRLISTALPRVRDFRGVRDTAFDGRGNYTVGVKEHTVFPDLESDKVENARGLNVTVVTTAEDDEQATFLLREIGMPFRRPREEEAARPRQPTAEELAEQMEEELGIEVKSKGEEAREAQEAREAEEAAEEAEETES